MKYNIVILSVAAFINLAWCYRNTVTRLHMLQKSNNNNHLDIQNRKRLEKMFYLKNRRYSPYNKQQYLRSVNDNTTVSEAGTVIIGKHLVDSLNKQLQDAYQTPEKNNDKEVDENLEDEDEDDDYDDDEEPDIREFKQLLDNMIDGKTSSDQSNGDKHPSHQGGFMGDDGVYRYRDPTIFLVSPQQQQQKRQQQKKGPDNEFDTGSQFQIIKNSDFSFKDIGGYEKVKSELLQTADILVNFDKYRKYNVRTPKGIIFEGPPGNGKTLMAKGFCGEINVTFIPVSGSEFSEKYVGVGASRVRELFKLAHENRPAVIFIDEIDALARKRGNDLVTSNSEKDQTLNQLLISLDGFRDTEGVFVIGATNRIDLLDSAILRPGRMDKNIYIGNPDAETRAKILEIHLKGKPVHPENVQVSDLVEMSAGFSGAQIENWLNEAMLRALRENREVMTMDDLEYISHRVLAGEQTSEHKFSDDMINRIVMHEIGHAIVGMFSKDHPKLQKVCLNRFSPRTPGYTVFETSDENVNIYTKQGLMSHLMVLLSGRIAEDVFFGYSVTTGARKDFEEAYKLAQNMVTQFGFGKQIIYPEMSDRSKFLIDEEVNALILEAQENALNIITTYKDLMVECASILKTNGILKPEQIEGLCPPSL